MWDLEPSSGEDADCNQLKLLLVRIPSVLIVQEVFTGSRITHRGLFLAKTNGPGDFNC